MQLEQLVELLCCPETRQDLRLADPAELECLNQAIRDGRLASLDGEKVETPATGALVRADNEVIYLVQNNIPVMLGVKAVRYAEVMDESRYQPGEEGGDLPPVRDLAGQTTADTTDAGPLPETP
ncbi:MAG: hypothetical protein AAGK14_10090 [Verrucomicrobiota bacterium]